jgi:cell division septation protein DedD
MDIAKYISETLEYKEKVAIKGFGTFSKIQTSATINNDTDSVEPPKVVYTFDPLVSQEDCIHLIEHIGNERNLSVASANYFIENWVEVLIKELENNPMVDRSPVGYFTKNAEGYIELHDSAPSASKSSKKGFFSFLSLNSAKAKTKSDAKASDAKKSDVVPTESTSIPSKEELKEEIKIEEPTVVEEAKIEEKPLVKEEPKVEVKKEEPKKEEPKEEVIIPPVAPIIPEAQPESIEPEPHQAIEEETTKPKTKKVKQSKPPSYIETALAEDIVPEKKKNRLVPLTALLVIVLGLGAIYWFYGAEIQSLITSPKEVQEVSEPENTIQNDSNTTQTEEIVKDTLNPTTNPTTPNNTAKQEVPTKASTPVKQPVAKVNYGVIPDMKMDAKYQIVLGSFSSMDEAAKRLDELKESGYNKGIRVIDNKGKIRLCAGGFDDYNQTKAVLNSFYRSKVDKEAWILQL